MEEGHVIPAAIRELLDKRSTFQEWLRKLDELGDEFRPEVAEKVRGDYAGRLSDVETELGTHRAELETALADRLQSVDRVTAEHDARSAELEETRLRHVVGEFDDDEWESRRSEHQGRIDELEERLASQRSAVESLQAVLGELTGAAAAPLAPAATPVAGESLADADDDRFLASDEEMEQAVEDDAEAVEDEEAPALVADLAGGAEERAIPHAPDWEEAAGPEPVEAEEVASQLAELEVVEDEAVDSEPPASAEDKSAPDVAEPVEFMDELEFLESLSLDDADHFDAVSAMLDEDEGDSKAGDSKRETEGS